MTNSELRQELLKLADWLLSFNRPAYWPEWDMQQAAMLRLAAERIPEDAAGDDNALEVYYQRGQEHAYTNILDVIKEFKPWLLK